MGKKLSKIAPFQHFRGTFDSSVFCVHAYSFSYTLTLATITGNVSPAPGHVGIFPPRGLTTCKEAQGKKVT